MRDQELIDLYEAYTSIYTNILESHFKVGDEVICKKSGMEGEVVKVDSEEKEKYYTVKREDGKRMKYAPDELKKSNGGTNKENEEKFHSKLDKLVHKTFGKSPEEQKEEFDLFDTILEYLVAEGYADTNENALVIMTNMSGEWRESIFEYLNLPVAYNVLKPRPTADGTLTAARNNRLLPTSGSGVAAPKPAGIGGTPKPGAPKPKPGVVAGSLRRIV